MRFPSLGNLLPILVPRVQIPMWSRGRLMDWRTVTDTPTGQLLGTYFFVGTGLGADAFTVDAGGNVTFADAVFTGGDVALFFGGYGGFTPQLVDDAAGTPDWNSSGQTTFSSAPTAVPFDFSPTPAVVILGGIFAAKKLRNKLVKK